MPDLVVGPVKTPIGPPGAPKGSGVPWDEVSRWAEYAGSSVEGGVVGTIGLAVGWLFGSPQSPVHKAYASVSGAVTHYVHDVISWAIALVMGVVGAVHALVTELFTLVHTAQKDVNGAIDWIKHAPTWVIARIEDAKGWIGHNIVDPAVHAAMDAAKSAEHGLTGAIDTVKKWVTKLVHNLIDPIVKELRKLPGDVAKYADAAVHTVVNDAVDPINATIATMGSSLDGLVKTITPDVLTALKALAAAADWIIWFGEHTFTDLEQLLTGWEGATVKQIEPGKAAFVQSENDLQGLFKSLLG